MDAATRAGCRSFYRGLGFAFFCEGDFGVWGLSSMFRARVLMDELSHNPCTEESAMVPIPTVQLLFGDSISSTSSRSTKNIALNRNGLNPIYIYIYIYMLIN